MLTEFLRDYGSPLAWLVAACGWLVAHHQALSREIRKEIREEVKAVTDLVLKLPPEFNAYRRTPGGSIDAIGAEARIKLLLQDLGLRLEHLKLHQQPFGQGPRLALDDAEARFSELFESVTGGDFESATRRADDQDAQELAIVNARSLRVSDAMTRAFASAYP